MIINGVELENIDLMDSDVMERVENAIDSIAHIDEQCEGMKTSAAMKYQCNAIFQLFNNIFGEGTDKKIFGDKTNLLVCIKAFEEFVAGLNEQNAEIEKLRNRYSKNRAQRRVK